MFILQAGVLIDILYPGSQMQDQYKITGLEKRENFQE